MAEEWSKGSERQSPHPNREFSGSKVVKKIANDKTVVQI
jgi:hypothetical protein